MNITLHRNQAVSEARELRIQDELTGSLRDVVHHVLRHTCLRQEGLKGVQRYCQDTTKASFQPTFPGPQKACWQIQTPVYEPRLIEQHQNQSSIIHPNNTFDSDKRLMDFHFDVP